MYNTMQSIEKISLDIYQALKGLAGYSLNTLNNSFAFAFFAL